jgi:hypothetical protein
MMKHNEIPPPRVAKRGILAEVPKVDAPAENLATSNSGTQDLNFKVDPQMHRAFRTAASIKGLKMKELLEASFRCWVEHYGDDTIKALVPK